ncbi:MAG: TonB-dependent receptor [Pseudomonadota bacterium]
MALILIGWGLCMIFPCETWASSLSGAPADDTLLVFVGEELEVLSIASRREESAWNAPAVAEVVTRQQIQNRGLNSLGEVLALIPGFHMAEKEDGFTPYLRGIPNSVLFLYETVPMGSDVTKSIHPIGYETSLAAIKRVEVVRGPGSALWGPDAFAGIVNLVPLSGKDAPGVETAVSYEAPGDHAAAYVNLGHDGGIWDSFLSISAREGRLESRDAEVVRFWGNENTPVAPSERFGADSVDDAGFMDVVGRCSYGNWLFLSGRLSESEHPYVITSDNGDLSWKEERDVSSGFFKFETKKQIDDVSALRTVGYYAWMALDHAVIDRTLHLREKSIYGEMLYDRSYFNNRGLFTGGVSYREKHIDNAPIWDSYFPDYLGADNETFLPGVEERDYGARLWSTFFQFSHKYQKFDFSFGGRFDGQSEYEDRISYNAGLVWSPSDRWQAKLLYGTAYRTPYSRQLLLDDTPDPESIESLNAQVSWKPFSSLALTAGIFCSRIDHHIMEDPYAGLSEPNDQEITGVEVEAAYNFSNTFDIAVNLTVLDNRGPEETYRYNDYDYFRPDGSVEKHFVDLVYPYNAGPEKMANFIMTWRPVDRCILYIRWGYFSGQKLIFPRDDFIIGTDGQWRIDTSITWKNVFQPGMDLNFTIKNIADERGGVPGTYDIFHAAPVSARLELRKKW